MRVLAYLMLVRIYFAFFIQRFFLSEIYSFRSSTHSLDDASLKQMHCHHFLHLNDSFRDSNVSRIQMSLRRQSLDEIVSNYHRWKVQMIKIAFFWIFCLNHCLWIFTWKSLMINCELSWVKIRIVWKLSHWICISEFDLNSIALKKFLHQISSLIAFDIVRSSASVKFVITVFCFEIFQSIMSLKRQKQ